MRIWEFPTFLKVGISDTTSHERAFFAESLYGK
jgi:hypothetical protein